MGYERLVLTLTILTATTMLLFVPFVHGLMPVYASEMYEVGPAGLGLLMSVVGIGSIFGTVLVASVGDIRNWAISVTRGAPSSRP